LLLVTANVYAKFRDAPTYGLGGFLSGTSCFSTQTVLLLRKATLRKSNKSYQNSKLMSKENKGFGRGVMGKHSEAAC
jgi:hypothetical protein